MAAIQPLPLGIVGPKWASEVPSPPHDALSPSQRREHLDRHPYSYLGVTLAPDDVAPGQVVTPEELLGQAQAQIDRLVEAEVFETWSEPTYFLYRLTVDGHSQTGLVCGVSVDDYDQGVIRIHERIKADRAKHLARHLGTIKAQSSPIAFGISETTGLGEVLLPPTGADPLVDVITEDGLHQQVWAITDASSVDAIEEAVSTAPLYLVDGHHRAAAASTHRKNRSISEQESDFSWMLGVIFPLDQLNSKAFHRVVHGIEDRQAFIDQLTAIFATRRVSNPTAVAERSPGEVAVAIGDDEWLLVDLPVVATSDDPDTVIANLDPVRLNSKILYPLLGIDESHPGSRLTYWPGFADAASIEEIKPGEGEMIFIMRPVSMAELTATADAQLIMPPKSTYFEPKVRSGIFFDQKSE